MPEKDRYFFQHDYNARHDRKIAGLLKDFKSSGYGIFWAICEIMHEEGGSLEFDDLTISSISKDLNEDENLVKNVVESCIEKYKLFTKQDFLLQSKRVRQNLDTRKELKKIKAEAGRIGGLKSGESRRYKNESKQNEADLEASNQRKGKERKGKEIKGNSSEQVGASFEIEKILNPESFPTWRTEVSNFLKDEYFIQEQVKDKKIKYAEMVAYMKQFVYDKNLEGDFKNVPALKKHFGYWYKKYHEQRNRQVSHSKAFIEVPEDFDYEKDMITT